VLHFEIFADYLLIFDIYVQKFRTLFVLTLILLQCPAFNERQRGEAIGFLSRGEDQISVPERFHVSQSTLSRFRRRMRTTGSLNDHFRSGRPRVATLRQDQETPFRLYFISGTVSKRL
jgi:hypothetical protein